MNSLHNNRLICSLFKFKPVFSISNLHIHKQDFKNVKKTNYLKKNSKSDLQQNIIEEKINIDQDAALNYGKLSKKILNKSSYLESEFLENDPDNLDRMEIMTDKKPRNFYLFEIKKLIYKDKKIGVRKALDLHRQMKIERKRIDHDFYKMLIKGCGLVGFFEKAFELFEEYLNLNPNPINRSIVTSMFNCCSNCPNKQVGIEKAKFFYDFLVERGYSFNLKNYHVIIKTFGVLGDLETAFAFLDKFVNEKFQVTSDVFSFLLMGACSDKTQGLSIATNLIQSMRYLNLKPELHTYNLLYRAIRDCGFGSEDELKNQIELLQIPEAITSDFLQKVLVKQRELLKKNYQKALTSKELVIHQETPNKLLNINFLGSNVDSLKHHVSIVDIDYESLKKPENRLQLLGGLNYLINYMEQDKVLPNIKTLSLLTEIIPSEKKYELELINLAFKLKIKLDTDFFNLLMKKACMRRDRDTAMEYLKLMTSKNLAPNIQTYGVLAISCYKYEDMITLLNDMENSDVNSNVIIYTQFFRNATQKSNFIAMNRLLNKFNHSEIKPDHKLTEQLLIANELGSKAIQKLETSNELETESGRKLKNTFLVFKKNLLKFLNNNFELDDSVDILDQFKPKEIPRNENYHLFKVQMTKLLNAKKEYFKKKLNTV